MRNTERYRRRPTSDSMNREQLAESLAWLLGPYNVTAEDVSHVLDAADAYRADGLLDLADELEAEEQKADQRATRERGLGHKPGAATHEARSVAYGRAVGLTRDHAAAARTRTIQ